MALAQATAPQKTYRFQQDKSAIPCQVNDAQGRFSLLFAPYDARVIYSDTEEAIFGRGVMPNLAPGVRTFNETPPQKPWLTVGRMCEAADGTNLLFGGEHHNDHVVNMSFGNFMDMVSLMKRKNTAIERTRSRGPIIIGDAVVISSRVTILSGVTIGTGAVLAAGCVVTSDVLPFAIVGGTPAKVIRYRFPEEIRQELLRIRWWDFEFYYLFEHLPRIKALSPEAFIREYGDTAKHRYISGPADGAVNRLVFRKVGEESSSRMSFGLAGIDLKGKFVSLRELNEEIKAYAAQVNLPAGSMLYPVKDIFAYL